MVLQPAKLNVAVTVAALQHDGQSLGYVLVFEDLSDLLKAQKQAAWREVLGELGWQHDRAAEAEDDLLALLATSRPGAANFQTSTSSADQ